MREPLRVAVGQFGAALGDVGANLARMRAMLADAAQRGAALACFPELCLSGYLLAREDYTDGLLDAVRDAEQALGADARRLGVDLVYGTPSRGDAGLVNAVVLQRADGGRLVYAKAHMDVKERRVFAPGGEFVVAPDSGLGLACCYDLAFPEAMRLLALRGARLVVVPMAWEVERGWVMRHVCAARAVENVAHVICVNQAGAVGDLRFQGASRVVDPLGATTLELGDAAAVAVADVDLDLADRLRDGRDRRTYPLLNDRRPELYGSLAAPEG